MFNILHITSMPHAHDLQITLYMYCVEMFMTNLCTKFHTPNFSDSSVTDMKLEAKYNLCTDITLLFQILQKYCLNKTCTYSGISIYRSRNDRFSACTVRNFWSRIKFHINNVIYFRIHRFPNYRFSALIVCKSRSRRSISRVDRLKKKN